MITIKYVPNILSKDGRREKVFDYDREAPLSKYIKLSGFDAEDHRVIVSGKIAEDISVILSNGDEIIVTPHIEGWLAPVIAWIWSNAAVILAVVSIAYSIYQACTYKKPTMPSFDSLGDGIDESSPTYGWDGIQTTQEVGIAVPVVYGQHKIGGNIINVLIRTDGENNYLQALLALCQGEIEDISNIKINDQPLVNYTGVSSWLRMGTNSDSVIPNFEELHSVIDLSQTLNNQNDSHVYTTVLTNVEAFEVRLKFPSGIYYQWLSDGSINNWWVMYKIEYKLHSASSWTIAGLYSVVIKSRTELRRYQKITGLTAGQYDIRVTRTSATGDFYHTGDLTLQSIDEIRTADLSYPNVAKLGVSVLATTQLSGGMPQFSCIVKGKKIKTPDVRDSGNNYVAYDNYYWDPAADTYKKLADSSVLTWDGVTYVTAYSANPIWCLYDLLTHDRYGLGEVIDTSLITDSEWADMAQYCDERVSDGDGGYEKRFRMDVVLDSAARAPDVLQQIAGCFRGMIFVSEGMIKVVIDKEASPVQIFGIGNMIKGTFRQSWRSLKEVVNVIDVQFMDLNKDYKQEQISVIDETAIAAGDPVRKKQIKVFCTRMSQAIREGKYQLNSCKYVTRSVTFRAGIDAIACQIGDVISISHDVPQWGFSGKVLSGSTTSLVKLDQSIIIEAGKTYKIRVKFSDDTIEEKTVIDAAGTYTEVNISGTFSQAPAEFDNYAFGESGKVVKDFRVMQIKRVNEFEVEIMAIEYNASIYDTDTITIPTANASMLTLETPDVTDLALTERIVKLADGTIENVVDVWFNHPVMSSYQVGIFVKAQIYISENAGTTWVGVGETAGRHFAIQGGIVDGQSYRVAVVSQAQDGRSNAIDDSPYVDITIAGKTAPPSDVTGFDVYQEGNLLRFSWNASSDVDLARYIIKQGSEWSTGSIIGEKVDTTEFVYPVGEIGLLVFMIKAVDTSGNESTNPAIDTLTVIPPPDMNFMNTEDIWRQDLKYILSNVELIMRNDYDAGYVRPVLALKTADTWEEREAESQTWEYQEANSGLILNDTVEASGYYQMNEPIDLQTIFEFKILLDVDYKNVAGGTVTIQISISEDDSTYSAFADVDGSTLYRARYLKFKVIPATSDASHNVYIYSCSIYINAPTAKSSWVRDMPIPIIGKTILFDAGFTFPPRVVVTIVNGIVGFPVVDNKTADQCDIKVYDISGSAIGTAEVDIDCKGY